MNVDDIDNTFITYDDDDDYVDQTERNLRSALKQPGQSTGRSIVNHVSICQDEMEIIGDSPPNVVNFYDSVLSVSSCSINSTIRTPINTSQAVISPTSSCCNLTPSTTPLPSVVPVKKPVPKTPEERKLERDKKKEEKKIKKFQREEEAKFHAIAESKNGRYVKYDSKIGEGGYKIVSRGFDKDTCRDIAWCEVRKEHIDSREKRQTMLKEVKIMLSLDHPNVVKCYDVLTEWYLNCDEMVEQKRRTEQKGLVIIQELMNEGTLKGMIKKNFHNGLCILENELIIRWWYQILDVLRYMHTRTDPPIMHRDVKSDNLFLASQPDEDAISVKIGDFGLATTINKNSQRKTMIGTIGFMAPEVYEEKYDIKVDIYAFGMMMLEVITNRTPYDDCTNIIQVLSKSISKHLPDVISHVSKPLIREVMMACVHPFKLHRPTAEELCEHPLFEKAIAVVTPFLDNLDRSETINKFIKDLETNDPIPVIGISINVAPEFLAEPCLANRGITFFFDVYQKQDQDITELMLALKKYLLDFIKITPRRYHHLEKITNCIQLQIQYLVKVFLGERWRALFNNLMQKEPKSKRLNNELNKKQNSDDSKYNENNVLQSGTNNSNNNTNNINNNNANINGNNNNNNNRNANRTDLEGNSTFNITEYSRHWLMFAKTTNLLDKEIDNYCLKVEKLNRPYFFNISYPGRSMINCLNNPTTNIIDPKEEIDDTGNVFDDSTTQSELGTINDDCSSDFVGEETRFGFVGYDDCDIDACTDTWDDNSASSLHAVVNSSQNMCQNEEIYNVVQNPVKYIQPQHGITPINQNVFSPDIKHYRHYSEPSLSQSNGYPYQANSSYPSGPCLSSSFSISNPEPPQNQCSGISVGVDTNQSNSYIQTYNLQTALVPGGNYYYHQQQFVNYYQPNLLTSSKVVLPSNNSVVNGFYCQQLTDPHLMQNNLQYSNIDQNSRHTINSIQTLTRSLPNSAMTTIATGDSVTATSILHATSLTSVVNVSSTPIRSSTSNQTCSVVGSSNPSSHVYPDNNIVFQRQNVAPVASNTCQTTFINQKVTTPPILSTNTKPATTRAPNNIPTNQSNIKQLEKSSKLKKPKSRLKSKYVVKVTDITEIDSGETVVAFEMILLTNQMRFNCSLSNEINTMDVSNCVKESVQIPGELSRKEILESLVLTVKKICQCLLEDINSVSLQTEYIFYPPHPSQNLIKSNDVPNLQMNPLSASEISNDGTQLLPNHVYLTNTNTQLTLGGSCASSRSLSRHPSNEELSLPSTNFTNNTHENPIPSPYHHDSLSNSITPTYLHDTLDGTSTSPFFNIQKKSSFPPPPSPVAQTKFESNVRVPEYMTNTIKQIVEKLQHSQCRGVIILNNSFNSQSQQPFKVFEMADDFVYVGIPSNVNTNTPNTNDASHSSPPCPSGFSIVRCPVDKEFIISHKSVYQNPAVGSLLLHPNGEMSHLQKPCIVCPPSLRQNVNSNSSTTTNNSHSQKAIISELSTDMHQAVDQVTSTLQAMCLCNSFVTENNREESMFEEPILIDKKSVATTNAGSDSISSNQRRGSTDSVVSHASAPIQTLAPIPTSTSTSQIQVECLSFEYVPPSVNSDTNIQHHQYQHPQSMAQPTNRKGSMDTFGDRPRPAGHMISYQTSHQTQNQQNIPHQGNNPTQMIIPNLSGPQNYPHNASNPYPVVMSQQPNNLNFQLLPNQVLVQQGMLPSNQGGGARLQMPQQGMLPPNQAGGPRMQIPQHHMVGSPHMQHHSMAQQQQMLINQQMHHNLHQDSLTSMQSHYLHQNEDLNNKMLANSSNPYYPNLKPSNMTNNAAAYQIYEHSNMIPVPAQLHQPRQPMPIPVANAAPNNFMQTIPPPSKAPLSPLPIDNHLHYSNQHHIHQHSHPYPPGHINETNVDTVSVSSNNVTTTYSINGGNNFISNNVISTSNSSSVANNTSVGVNNNTTNMPPPPPPPSVIQSSNVTNVGTIDIQDTPAPQPKAEQTIGRFMVKSVNEV